MIAGKITVDEVVDWLIFIPLMRFNIAIISDTTAE